MTEFNFVTEEDVDKFMSNNDTEKCIKYLMTYRSDKVIMVVVNTYSQTRRLNYLLSGKSIATSMGMQPPIGLEFDYIFFDNINLTLMSQEFLKYQMLGFERGVVAGTKVYYKND